MAHLDPSAHLRVITAPSRFKLKIHDIAPEAIEPNGDRYVVEVIDLDETIQLGQMLVVTQDPTINEKDPMADPKVEKRGVLAAVIVDRGNGHLLGLPDPVIVDGKGDLQRPAANVPMFYQPGDVVFVDHNAKGRNVKIVGRECRIVGQIDILARVRGVRLRRGEDGDWEREE